MCVDVMMHRVSYSNICCTETWKRSANITYIGTSWIWLICTVEVWINQLKEKIIVRCICVWMLCIHEMLSGCWHFWIIVIWIYEVPHYLKDNPNLDLWSSPGHENVKIGVVALCENSALLEGCQETDVS